ncbi:MAG: hypothetical protein K6G42_06795 [Lachnospiraceae bacterium]|nr:hypothetical protein [Lachnospiraceae bacterium]
MDFVERINLLLGELEADNVSVARYGGFDRTSLSRFRNGKRVPSQTGRTSDRLVNGIYLFACNKNDLDTLCRITGGDPKGTADEIKDSVRLWLYDGMPVRNTSEMHRHRKLLYKSFGEKLDTTMTLADISNVRMSKYLNVDSSLISRYRAGLRIPRSNQEIAVKMSEILWDHIQKQKKNSELAAIMGYDADETAREDFFRWLYDIDPIYLEESAGIEKIITAFDSFPDRMGEYQITDNDTPEVSNAEKSLYIGREGLREAVLRFLRNTIKSRAKELWLYSDENMDWMTADLEFTKKWGLLMSNCVSRGTRIRIIHNIDRGVDEMSSAIINWLPLYMIGMIESYYCKKNAGRRFSHTMFICPGKAVIEAFHVRGTESTGKYHYCTDSELVSLSESAYTKLMEASLPLVSIVEPGVGRFSKGGVTSVRNSLSLATMSEELIDSFDSVRLKNIWRVRKKEMTSILQKGNVCECVALAVDELPGSGHEINSFHREYLDYTGPQYVAHLRDIIELLNRYTNYRFYILPESPFRNVNLDVGDDFVKITSAFKPGRSIIITHPLMIAAFKDYVDSICERHSIDKNTLIRKLNAYAEKILKDTVDKGNVTN